MATSALIGEKELLMNLYMFAMTSSGFCSGRDGGAMNSGPAGSLIDSRTISSMAFDASFEQVIGWLRCVERGRALKYVHLLQRVVAHSDGPDLALLVKLVHRRGGLLYGNQRIRPMNLVDIDVIGLQATQ